jgi:hypothetical protein
MADLAGSISKKERDSMAVRGTTPDYTLTLAGYDIKGVE